MSIEFTIKHQPGGHKLCMETGLKWSADQTLSQKTCFYGRAQKPMCTYYTDMQILMINPDLNCWILSIKVKSCA